MIKTLCIMLSTAAALFFSLHLTHFDAGSVTIAIDTYELHTSFWFFIAAALLLLLLCIACDRLLRLLASLSHRSSNQLALALRHILDTGQWPQAAKQLQRLGLKKHQHHLQGLSVHIHELLKPGLHTVDTTQLPPLTQGLLAMQREDWVLALSIWSNKNLKIPLYLRLVLWLKTLRSGTQVEPTLIRAFYNEAQPELRALIKYHPNSMLWLYQQLLSTPIKDIKLLCSLWRDMPKAVRQKPSLIIAMAKQLTDVGLTKDAEMLLLPHLETSWSADILTAYMATLTDPQKKYTWLMQIQKKAPAHIQPYLYAEWGMHHALQGDCEEAAKCLALALGHPSCPNKAPMAWHITHALSLSRLGQTQELTGQLEKIKQMH